jgi:hypothetical protein
MEKKMKFFHGRIQQLPELIFLGFIEKSLYILDKSHTILRVRARQGQE